MKMTTAEFDQRLVGYLQSVLLPECKSGIRKFAIGALIGTGRVSVKALPAEMSTALGIVDADGNVDVEVLKKAANCGIGSAGEVAVFGLHFTKADVDRLFNYIEKGVLG